MNTNLAPLPYSHRYAELDARLTGRCAQSRKVANNTYLQRRPNGDIAVKLHRTDVVTFHADGTATLNTDGWLTVTSKARINEWLPGGIGLSSVKGRWFLTYPGHWDGVTNTYVPSERKAVPYSDGVVLDLVTLDVIEGAPEPTDVAAEDAANIATRKAIATYLHKTTASDIVYAFTHVNGDCWVCAGRLLDADPDHLRMHVEEQYVMYSLAFNAITERGFRYPDAIVSTIYNEAQRGQVSRFYTDSVRKYLVRHLVTGVAVK